MAAIRNEGRKTRSQGVVLEEKGKQEMEETLRSIYLDISEESEEQEGDRKDYVAEQAPRPTLGGKVGKWLKHSASVGVADDDVGEDVSEDDEDEEYAGSRGRGRGRRGRGSARGRGKNRAGKEQYEEGYSAGVSGRKRGKKDMRRKLQEAEDAYVNETHHHIRRIIDHLEEEALQDQSDPEMADWENFLPDPGHTRGRMSLYKQSLHVYWGMKRLLARGMEQVAGEMVELAQANIKKEMKNLQMTLMMQDRKMDQLIQLLKDNGIVKAEPDTRTDDAMKP